MTAKTLAASISFRAPDAGNESAVEDFAKSCAESFLAHGAVVINGVYPPDYIAGIGQAYDEAYGNTVNPAKEVGDKRTMLAIDIRPPFNDPDLFAPAAVMRVLRKLLGSDCILDSYVAVTSRPDSADQHVHVDFPFLFDEDEGLSQSLPPYAITLAIPLIPLNAMTGVTRIWPGTHRRGIEWKKQQPDLMDSLSVVPEPGGCYLFDARLLHGGTANYTASERPILYLIFCRPWWRDSTNFYNQKPLLIGSDTLAALPAELQALFRYAN
ncbi:MAG: phytanoyl-CoA dioxygenase family protein [Pseudomonadota bacterium]